MKRVLTIFLLLFVLKNSIGQQINYIGYFIDNDPGLGNETPIIFSPANDVELTFTIPLSDVSEGFHNLYLRSRDNTGQWSLTSHVQMFTLKILTPALISRLEYFKDNDPGIGNGTEISLNDSQNSIESDLNIPLTNDDEGFHTLYIRSRDTKGSWSIVEHFSYYNVYLNPGLKLKSVEYFIDDDPGFGEGYKVEIPVSSQDTVFTFQADLSCILPGNHKFYVRTLDSLDHWSHTIYDDFNQIVGNAIIITNGQTNVCYGDSVKLEAFIGDCISYQWNKDNIPILDENLSYYYAKESGNYSLTETCNNNTVTSQQVTVTVNPQLTVYLGEEDTISYNTSILLNSLVTGGYPAYTYIWNDGSMESYNLCTLNADSTFSLTVTDNIGCSAENSISIHADSSHLGSVSGSVTYSNQISSPLKNVTIELLDNGIVQRTTTSNSAGVFCFSNVNPGNYECKYSSVNPSGGYNSVDALKTLQHFVHMITLTGINKKAGDVDGSGNINSIDGLNICKRFVALINNFIIGDWIFNTENVITSPNQNQVLNPKGLCSGDVDGSFIP